MVEENVRNVGNVVVVAKSQFQWDLESVQGKQVDTFSTEISLVNWNLFSIYLDHVVKCEKLDCWDQLLLQKIDII